MDSPFRRLGPVLLITACLVAVVGVAAAGKVFTRGAGNQNAAQAKANESQSQEESKSPALIEVDKEGIDKLFAGYKKQTGQLPAPLKRKVQCRDYGPTECAILLGRRAPFGCTVCCIKCEVPLPPGHPGE